MKKSWTTNLQYSKILEKKKFWFGLISITIALVTLILIAIQTQISSDQIEHLYRQNEILIEQKIANQQHEIRNLFRDITNLISDSVKVEDVKIQFCVSTITQYPDSIALPIIIDLSSNVVSVNLDTTHMKYFNNLMNLKMICSSFNLVLKSNLDFNAFEFQKVLAQIMRIKGQSLDSVHLTGSYLKDIDLQNCILDKSQIKSSYLEGANFKDSDLGSLKVKNVIMDYSNFSGADLTNSIILLSYMNNCKFIKRYSICNLSKAYIGISKLNYCNFSDAFASGTIFYSDAINQSLFNKTDLTGTAFIGCDLSLSNFLEANIENALFFLCNFKNVKYLNKNINSQNAIFLNSYYLSESDSIDMLQKGAIFSGLQFKKSWANLEWNKIDKEKRIYFLRNYLFMCNHWNSDPIDDLQTIGDEGRLIYSIDGEKMFLLNQDILSLNVNEFIDFVKEYCPSDSIDTRIKVISDNPFKP